MALYNRISYRFSRRLTLAYSSSFGLGSRLLSRDVRPHVYAIYGLVRIADEIVDTYQGTQADSILDELESDVYRAIRLGYSANPIVQSFALTVQQYVVDPAEIKAFFKSMRMDLTDQTYDAAHYLTYIHGSAEAVGLMCLSIFVNGDAGQYRRLKPGAMALGAAFQKVNFLRDLAADQSDRGRFYFPGHNYTNFNEAAKRAVISDITADFQVAAKAINQLPKNSRRAVLVSYNIYLKLLDKLRQASIDDIKTERIRISMPHKLLILVQSLLQGKA